MRFSRGKALSRGAYSKPKVSALSRCCSDQGLTRWLDILVSNAGVSAVGPVEANDDSDWARVLDVDVIGIARTTRAALPRLHRSDAGALADLSSVAAGAGLPAPALYSASKYPASKGAVHTAPGRRLLARGADPAVERVRLRARPPMGRLVSAEGVAEAVCYLAGSLAGAFTGIALAVDGGMDGLRLPPAYPAAGAESGRGSK